MDIPQDAGKFTDTLQQDFKRRPGPMGYFNPKYMAFTRKQAKQFPNLVSLHSLMRKFRNGGHPIHLTSSMLNATQIANVTLDGKKIKRHKISKKNLFSPYPITTIFEPCEETIGGLDRLCVVCPAVTDLGPDKIPRYINELLCEGDEFCGIGPIQGICQNTVLIQDFLMIEFLGLEVYSQPIRACCECSIFP